MNLSEVDIFREKCENCQRLDLLDMINDAVVLIKSQNGEILFMNEKALAMYQYTDEEAISLSIEDISHDSVAANYEKYQIAKQYAGGYVFTANHVKKNGSIFKVEISTRYINFSGDEIFVAIMRNLSQGLKLQEELELAGKVQRRFLPRDLDEDLFRIRSIYQPHNYVSGDLYDFCFDDNKEVLSGVLIDVMGHGVATAFQTSVLKYLFSRVIEKNIPINDKLAWMNKEVMPFFAGGGFAGVFLFELDFKCDTLTYSAGGINNFIILKKEDAVVVQAPGLFLGINQAEVFDQGVYRFRSGESLLFPTDGLFDLISQAINSELDFWGMHEMCKKLTASGDCNDDASGVAILIR